MIYKKTLPWKNLLDIPQGLIDSDKDGVFENLKLPWDGVQNKPSAYPSNIKLERVVDLSDTSQFDLRDIETNGDTFLMIGWNTYDGDGDDLMLYPNGNVYTDAFTIWGYWYNSGSNEVNTTVKLTMSGFTIMENYKNETFLFVINTAAKQGVKIRGYGTNAVALNGLAWNDSNIWETFGILSSITLIGKLFIFRLVIA